MLGTLREISLSIAIRHLKSVQFLITDGHHVRSDSLGSLIGHHGLNGVVRSLMRLHLAQLLVPLRDHLVDELGGLGLVMGIVHCRGAARLRCHRHLRNVAILTWTLGRSTTRLLIAELHLGCRSAATRLLVWVITHHFKSL